MTMPHGDGTQTCRNENTLKARMQTFRITFEWFLMCLISWNCGRNSTKCFVTTTSTTVLTTTIMYQLNCNGNNPGTTPTSQLCDISKRYKRLWIYKRNYSDTSIKMNKVRSFERFHRFLISKNWKQKRQQEQRSSTPKNKNPEQIAYNPVI